MFPSERHAKLRSRDPHPTALCHFTPFQRDAIMGAWDRGYIMNASEPVQVRTRHPAIIAVFNAKGGVGKTTTVVNLATCLAAFGRNILVVDIDAQGNCTASFGLEKVPKQGTYDLVTGKALIDAVITPTPVSGVSLVAATNDLSIADIDVASSPASHEVLRRIIRGTEHDFDLVLIDCPPAVGSLTLNALMSSHAVLVPANPTPYAREGLLRTWRIVRRMQESMNPRLIFQGVLLTLVEKSGSAAQDDVEQAIRAELGSLVSDIRVPFESSVFVGAAAHGIPGCLFAPDSDGTRSYLDLAEVILAEEPKLLRLAAGSIFDAEPKPHATRDEAMSSLQREHAEMREQGVFARKSALPEIVSEAPYATLSSLSETAPSAKSWSSRLLWLAIGLVVGGVGVFSAQPLIAALAKLN